MPGLVRDALSQDAMEVATSNVPSASTGKVCHASRCVRFQRVQPVTGHCKVGATTAVRCIDVAALVAASILRQNPRAEVLPFSTVVDVRT